MKEILNSLKVTNHDYSWILPVIVIVGFLFEFILNTLFINQLIRP